jgi:hypothetical protein
LPNVGSVATLIVASLAAAGADVAAGAVVGAGAEVGAGAAVGVAAAAQAARTSINGISALSHITGFLKNELRDMLFILFSS